MNLTRIRAVARGDLGDQGIAASERAPCLDLPGNSGRRFIHWHGRHEVDADGPATWSVRLLDHSSELVLGNAEPERGLECVHRAVGVFGGNAKVLDLRGALDRAKHAPVAAHILQLETREQLAQTQKLLGGQSSNHTYVPVPHLDATKIGGDGLRRVRPAPGAGPPLIRVVHWERD